MGITSSHNEVIPVEKKELRLIPVTIDNYINVIKLCVAPEQEQFVGTPAEAMADKLFHPQFIMCAIEHVESNKLIGFLMYDPASPKTNPVNNVALERFLLDCHFQGKGFGVKSLRLFVEHIRRAYPNTDMIELRTNTDNYAAIAVYRKVGFQVTQLEGFPNVQKGLLFLKV